MVKFLTNIKMNCLLLIVALDISDKNNYHVDDVSNLENKNQKFTWCLD